MSAPVEFRFFLPFFTLQDAEQGVTPIRQAVGPIVNGQAPMRLFTTPRLQFRYKEKLPTTNGQAEIVWSEWQDVPIVREGEAFNVGDIPVDDQTVRQ